MNWQRLKQDYSYAIPANHNEVPADFQLWIVNERHEELVFDKRKLTREEARLLGVIFSYKEPSLYQYKSQQERDLFDYLMNRRTVDLAIVKQSVTTPARFIHFYIKGTVNDLSNFEEAMKNIIPSVNCIFWSNENRGFIYQLGDNDLDEEISVDSVIDLIAGDFYVQITLFFGSNITNFKEMKTMFTLETTMFDKVRKIVPSKKVFKEQEVIPYLITEYLPDELRATLLDMLSPVVGDSELLQSVKSYLENNMNTSLAAKKMYMHRNTLQYRVEKFIEKTSIDIKKFQNAVAIYILFTLLEQS